MASEVIYTKCYLIAEQHGPGRYEKTQVVTTDDSVRKVIYLAIKDALKKEYADPKLATGNE